MLATHEPSSPTNNHIQHQIKEHVSNDSISCKKKKKRLFIHMNSFLSFMSFPFLYSMAKHKKTERENLFIDTTKEKGKGKKNSVLICFLADIL
jgi:hypothetical protein